MSDNSAEKMMVFSSVEMKQFLENAINDEAEHNRQSYSAVVEKTLCDRYAPRNESVCRILGELYNGVLSVQDASARVFNYLGSDGIKHVSRSAVVDLISYCRDLVSLNSGLVNSDPNPRLSLLLTGIEETLNAARQCDKTPGATELDFEVSSVQLVRDMVQNDIEGLQVAELYRIVTSNWDYLADVVTTYKLLEIMVGLHDWTGADRYEFAEILRTM